MGEDLRGEVGRDGGERGEGRGGGRSGGRVCGFLIFVAVVCGVCVFGVYVML